MRERLDGSPCSIFVVWFLLFTFLVYMNTYYIYMYELFNFPCLGLFNILYLCFSKLECPKPVLVFLWSKLIKKLDDNLESPMTQPHIYIYIYLYIFLQHIYIYTYIYHAFVHTFMCIYIYAYMHYDWLLLEWFYWQSNSGRTVELIPKIKVHN